MFRILILLSLNFLSLSMAARAEIPGFYPAFYSNAGQERQVSYRAYYRTELKDLVQLESLSVDQRERMRKSRVVPMARYLFGPLTNGSVGSPQKGAQIEVDWSHPIVKDSAVFVPYTYKGLWLLSKELGDSGLTIPIPYDEKALFTNNWKRCSDSAPDHQTASFLWYFWDPSRYGCDHKEGVQYQMATATLGASTLNLSRSIPEYDQLLKSNGVDKNLQMTFAFGYVEEPSVSDPEKDLDPGILEYRSFNRSVRSILGRGAKETEIKASEYKGFYGQDKQIGHRFTGTMNGVKITLNVVAAAGVDQMEIFSKSFAHDQDGFFGWFGHSRLGEGFDADNFGALMAMYPDFYRVTDRYQLIYWAGCNSYSYYTLPFFDYKIKASNGKDPFGTKGLDIVSNALPSLFLLNARNAVTMAKNLLRWNARPSFQNIIDELEQNAMSVGTKTLTVVLGDEDNPQ